MKNLPIDTILPDLRNTLLNTNNVVLVAPPGAGKTTRIPLALLDEPWLAGRKILVLEPRRLAARAAAAYMAASLGEQVGETVGYRVRLDTRVGPKTRIEVITEGVLTRMLQADPALEEAGIVIFDEFHERNLHADVGLAFCLQAQALLREELKILVMSATLSAEPVAELLGQAPILVSAGRAYPVETRYLPQRAEGRIEPLVVRTILEALQAEEGDLLVFLPGTGEIRRVEAQLANADLSPQVRVLPLHGSLQKEAQDLAIAPSRKGERKVVLATSIAETSLTVEGVRVVIDSGLMRVPRFSPRTGMTRLETVAVSAAAADQRRGRAGRLAAGVCYRLWTEQEDKVLLPHSTPEILEADLAPLALDLAAWGVSDPTELSWLDAPPAAAFAQARDLLIQLGALHRNDGTLTAHGKRMAELGLHPRLAHMVLRAIPQGLGQLACVLAALLQERDLFRGGALQAEADIRLRVDLLAAVRQAGSQPLTQLDRETADLAACRRVLLEAKQWQRGLGLADAEELDSADCGLLLAFAYPDRIAMRRGNGRYLLRNGRGAALAHLQALSNEPYLVAAVLDDQGTESRIFLAAPVRVEEIREHFADDLVEETSIHWDRSAQAVRARQRERLGALLFKDRPLADPNPDDLLEALLAGVAEEGLQMLPWSKSARQFRQRLQFLHQFDVATDWPDVSDAALLATRREWLGPHLYGMKSRDDLQKLDLTRVLEAMLPWNKRQELDEQAPTHFVAPSGSRLPIDYSDPTAPVLAVRLQEMFGLQTTPRIAHGQVPLTLHLLSPAHRPVQVTQDLQSFWQNTYFEVKKDLKGRYPKHYWPDDPLVATPTNRVRPQTK